MADVSTFTAQELFDFCATAIINQGVPSITERGLCKYRSPDGNKCAIGHLIPDDKYSPRMEGSLATAKHVFSATGLKEVHMDLVHSIQECHDIASEIYERDFLFAFKSHMRRTAVKYGLSYQILG